MGICVGVGVEVCVLFIINCTFFNKFESNLTVIYIGIIKVISLYALFNISNLSCDENINTNDPQY